MIDLILASSSPRRRAYFESLGLNFRILTADLDETPAADETPDALVMRLAQQKALAVAEKARGAAAGDMRMVIVAADTTVAIEGTILNKPADAAEARSMLESLRGRVHQVHSAVALWQSDSPASRVALSTNDVEMRDYTDAEIAAYIATGDPMDKAGGYAIQHPEFAPVSRLTGCGAGVVGLPLRDLVPLLAEAGIRVDCELAPICESKSAFVCCTRPG